MIQDSQRIERLKDIVRTIGSDIGERNLYRYDNLVTTANFIENALNDLGYSVSRQRYEAKNLEFSNLETGTPGIKVP